MNLPTKITIARVLAIPIFMLFVIPFPNWMLESEALAFIRPQLTGFNNFLREYGSYVGAVIFIIASSTDTVDGYLARKRKQVTRLGIFLDPIADKLLATAALIALVQRYEENTFGVSGWAAMIIIGRELIVTGFRLMAAGEGVVLAASKIGKLKTVAQTIAISATLLKNFPLSLVTDFRFDAYFMIIAVILTIYSGYDYIARNIDLLKSSKA